MAKKRKEKKQEEVKTQNEFNIPLLNKHPNFVPLAVLFVLLAIFFGEVFTIEDPGYQNRYRDNTYGISDCAKCVEYYYNLRELKTQFDDFDLLFKFGGFPESCLRGEEKFWRRWQRERLQRVIYDDIRDLENIKEISLLELLAGELPNRIGAPLSVKNLKELLQVAHETVDRWINIFERMYYCFRISPYGPRKVRAVKKEKKLYLWDWSIIPEEGPKFENFIASHLLKYCHFVEDTEGFKMDLRFLRDTDKREIDFVVLKDEKPLFAVECKTGEKNIYPSLFYYMERTPIPKFYQVHAGERDYEKKGVRVLPVHKFVTELALP